MYYVEFKLDNDKLFVCNYEGELKVVDDLVKVKGNYFSSIEEVLNLLNDKSKWEYGVLHSLLHSCTEDLAIRYVK